METVPKVVVVGGGTGLSTILRGLKQKEFDLTAVVTLTDEGGSSGILRKELNVPPPGDIRSNLVALATSEEILEKLFSFRFCEGTLNGHTVGNIILAALTKITGSFQSAVEHAGDILSIKGKVLPVSQQECRLIAEFEDGKTICGETNIVDYGKKEKKIKRVWLDREVELNKKVYESMISSDLIIIGPGSLYTSIIPNLLVSGFRETVQNLHSKIIYISNIMTQPGETTDYTLSDHINEVEKYLGREVDLVIHSLPPDDEEIISRYCEKNSKPIEVDIESDKVIKGKFSQILDNKIRHNSKAISEVVYNILEGVHVW